MMQEKQAAILLIHCPDKKGIVASVTEFLHKNKGNIISLDQHVDVDEEVFFMRVKWDITDFTIPKDKIGEYFQTLIADNFEMNWQLSFSSEKQRMAIFVSKMSHCLYDIISRCDGGELTVDIPVIISNHKELEHIANKFNIPFEYIPINAENKLEQEQKELDILREYKIDFIVLARYMQIISSQIIEEYQHKIINIHHSFLPAFPGAKPYHSAYKRGVKLIGATSHYVTEELDAGPIIAQDVTNMDHRSTIQDLVRKGRDLEKIVLARAIYAHVRRKTLVYNNRTIVFD
jgi:formyltetrahydrofolate deformylase